MLAGDRRRQQARLHLQTGVQRGKALLRQEQRLLRSHHPGRTSLPRRVTLALRGPYPCQQHLSGFVGRSAADQQGTGSQRLPLRSAGSTHALRAVAKLTAALGTSVHVRKGEEDRGGEGPATETLTEPALSHGKLPSGLLQFCARPARTKSRYAGVLVIVVPTCYKQRSSLMCLRVQAHIVEATDLAACHSPVYRQRQGVLSPALVAQRAAARVATGSLCSKGCKFLSCVCTRPHTPLLSHFLTAQQ